MEEWQAAAKGIAVNEIPVARDGIAIYLNKTNPITVLTIQQLHEIFTDSLTNWRQIGGGDSPIILYGRENSSGTHAFFVQRILKGDDFADRCEPLPGTAAVVHAVANDANGIGYGGLAWVTSVKYEDQELTIHPARTRFLKP